MKTAASLEVQLDKAKTDLSEVQSDIAHKLSLGEDARHLQRRRDNLVSKVSDLAPAVLIAIDREQQAQAAEDKKQRLAAAKEAQSAASKLCDAANAIDNALAELENKFTAFELARLDTERALRKAELDDGSKIKRTVGYALRWATWASAPAFAADSQLPRVEMTKRRSFLQSITVALPRIGDT